MIHCSLTPCICCAMSKNKQRLVDINLTLPFTSLYLQHFYLAKWIRNKAGAYKKQTKLNMESLPFDAPTQTLFAFADAELWSVIKILKIKMPKLKSCYIKEQSKVYNPSTLIAQQHLTALNSVWYLKHTVLESKEHMVGSVLLLFCEK